MDWRVSGQHSNELYHYGVKGMKWGVRKDDRSGKSRSSGKLTGGNLIDRIKDTLDVNRDVGSIKDQRIRTKIGIVEIDGFDTRQKKVADDVMDIISNAIPDRYASPEEAQRKLDSLEQNRYTMAYTRGYNQVSLANHDGPYYSRLINCFECSMAMEMRKRGYNVHAKEMDGGWSVEVMHAFDVKDGFKIQISPDRSYANDKTEAAKEAYNQIAQQCLSFGDGARGCLGVQWADGDSGHSMYWVVENGQFKIIDAQDSARDGYEVFMSPAEVIDTGISVYRLDNAELLPGVVDFVENYSAVTEEEKEKAKRKNPNMAEAKKIKEEEERKNKIRKEREETQRKAMKEIEAGRSTVEKLIRNVKKATNELVVKGKRFLKNPLNVKKNETITRTTTFSNVTWEVK